MQLNAAAALAEKFYRLLAPHCERIAVAGSIRRGRLQVKDIEIVCIPKTMVKVSDLYGGTITCRDVNFCNALEKLGLRQKGQTTGKYFQTNLPEGINVDVFMCQPDNWGYILAIRTGSADFCQHVLAAKWIMKGYKGEDGYLTADGHRVPIREEKELFSRLNIPWIEPSERENTPDIRRIAGLKKLY